MSTSNFDQYNSIPFEQYLEKKEGDKFYVDNENRCVTIFDNLGNIKAKVLYSAKIISIEHDISLLNKIGPRTNIYYVYEDGIKNCDWLWFYGNLGNIEDLFE
jgi:hypothetical protein